MAKSKATGRKAAHRSGNVQAILDGLDRMYPEAHCELTYGNPLQLLVATILSAQCTDQRVNRVTPHLFARYKSARELAEADPAVLQDEIRTTGFFRNKQKNIQGAASMLAAEHGGKVPRSMEALLRLPGVARKTANVVLGTAYGIAEGVVVDTHVRRISQRLGLTRHEQPEKIEQDLMAVIPRDRWIQFSHQIIWHGRRVCHARKPKCDACEVAAECDYFCRVVSRVR